MPEATKETEIAGVKYRMKLLGGEQAIRCGALVVGPGLRAVDELFTHVGVFGKLLERLTGGATDYATIRAGLDSLDWKDLSSLGDAHLPNVIARALEELGPDGLVHLGKVFADHTTVFVHSGVEGDPSLHPVPLSNRYDDHFRGKFPHFLAWLSWGCWAQGFFDVSGLLRRFTDALAEAKELSKSRPTSTGTDGGSSSPPT